MEVEKTLHSKEVSVMAKGPILSVVKYNIRLIPAIVKCRQLAELDLYFAHTSFGFRTNRMLSQLGAKLANGCPLIRSISLLNANLSIVSDYMDGMNENQLEILDVRCSQNEDIDFDQFVNLIKSLSANGDKLEKLAICFPPGKSSLFNPIKKSFETIGGRLSQLWSSKFYLFRPKEKLTVIGLDQLTFAKIGTSMSKVATDCPNVHSVIGYVHPSQSNLDAIKCWDNLTELHLSNFKSNPDYEKFRNFLTYHGQKLKTLNLKDLLEVSSNFWPFIRAYCVNLESLTLKHVYSVHNSSEALSFEISQMKTLNELQLSHIHPGFNAIQIFTILRSKRLISIIVYGHQELLDLWSKEVISFNKANTAIKGKVINLTGIVLS